MSQLRRIIAIGSVLRERVPFSDATAHAVSKAALTSVTRGPSRELGPNGITVNPVRAGATNTDASPADGEIADVQRSLTPLRRHAEPPSIAKAAILLARSAARVMTGAALTVEAGAMA